MSIDQAVKNLVGKSEKILAKSEEMLTTVEKLEPPPTKDYKTGTKTHNFMMYVYNGNIPATVNWAELMFKEDLEFGTINTFTTYYLQKLLKGCDAVIVYDSKHHPSIKTFARYLRKAIIHHLGKGQKRDVQPPSIPSGTLMMLELYQQAQAGYVPADGVWTDRFHEDMELVKITNFDPHYISKMHDDVDDIVEDFGKSRSSNTYNYASYLSQILQFHAKNPDYYYNLESD